MPDKIIDDAVLGQLIAGSLPLAQGNPMESIALVVRDLLGTDAVHLAVAADKAGRRVHYFAVPSAALHSTADPLLALTAALPGHPAHQGDGAYVLRGVEVSAAAVLRGGELRLYVNEPGLIDGVVLDSGLPAFDVSGLSNGWPLVSRRGEIQRVTDRASLIAVRGAGAVAALAAVVYVGLAGAETWIKAEQSGRTEATDPEIAVREALREVKLQSPLSEQLSRVQAVAATTVRAGGWIDTYQLERGREHFRVVLPEWVTRDYIVALAGDAKAEQRGEVKADLLGDGTIQLVKGSPGADGKPASGKGQGGNSAEQAAPQAAAAAAAAPNGKQP